MADTDDTAGKEKIVNILADIGTVRYLVNALGMPLVTTWQLTVNTICRMQIKRPSAKCHCIIKLQLLCYILLCEHVISFKAAAFALAGDGAHPFQGKVIYILKIPGVLDIVPNTIYDAP